MAEEPNQGPKKRRAALPERLVRRALESVGQAVDRKLGRTVDPKSGVTTDKLILQMNRLIDERVRDEGQGGRLAPHHLKLKVEWGKHSETPPEVIKQLETEMLAAAIDHINDNRYRILAPVKIETDVDIFTKGISVDPGFGEFDEELKQQDLTSQLGIAPQRHGKGLDFKREVPMKARVKAPDSSREIELIFAPGGRRLNVGRGTDNELHLNHASVSKIHAALLMKDDDTLWVADTGSTNGTHINGVRIPYGEAHPVRDGDVVAFGEVEVRLKRINP